MQETVLTLILFLFPLAFSPGPGNMFFAANGARFGLRATLPANLGYHLATWIVTAAIGLGLLEAMGRHPAAFSALRYAGAAYVLWLAWRLLRAGTLEAGEAAEPAGFLGGAVLLLLNPKAYLIIALMFTQFGGAPWGGPVAVVLVVTTVFTLNNFAAFLVWTLAGEAIAGAFRQARQARAINAAFAAVLAGVAGWMAIA